MLAFTNIAVTLKQHCGVTPQLVYCGLRLACSRQGTEQCPGASAPRRLILGSFKPHGTKGLAKCYYVCNSNYRGTREEHKACDTLLTLQAVYDALRRGDDGWSMNEILVSE